MTKFVYKMENILDIKYQLEEQAKINYGNAQMVLRNEEAKLEKLQEQYNNLQDKLTSFIQTKINLIEIQQCKEGLEIYKLHIKQQEKRVEAALFNVKNTRSKLEQSMIERKTHEKLKEKAKEAYLIEYEAHQQKVIDEITSYRYGMIAGGKEEVYGVHS